MTNKSQLGDLYTTNNEFNANVTLTVGNTSVNSLVNSTAFSIGNNTVNGLSTSILLVLANSVANTIIQPGTITTNSVTITGSLTANGSTGSAGQLLISNGTIAYWSNLNSAGANIQVQFNDSGLMNATAGFTFDKAANNVFVGNTVIATGIYMGNSVANLIISSTLVQIANASGTANLEPNKLTIGTSVVNSTVISTGAGQFINATAIKAANTGLITATSTAANGYTYLTGGILMQWGTVSANSSVGNATFPIAFPALCASISVTAANGITGDTGGTRKPFLTAAPNTTVAQIRTANLTPLTVVTYIAIGY